MKYLFASIILIFGTLFFLLPSITYTTHTDLVPITPSLIEEPLIIPLEDLESTDVTLGLVDTLTPMEEEPAPQTSSILVQQSPYKDLLKRNSDYRGWIHVPGSDISYPFVKSDDNDYYLKRSFDRSYDINGTVFMDYRNLGFGFSQHILLYGHNMKDGSMFGSLKRYKDPDYALEHTYIEIEDLYGSRTYRIYASYYAQADSGFIQTVFNDQEDFTQLIKRQVDLSDIAYKVTPKATSNILTLVTCTYEVDDGRYFVHAVEIP